MLAKLLYCLDEHLNLSTITFLFWACFWGLNGGDKYFNGSSEVSTDITNGVVCEEADGTIVYRIHPNVPVGWYGVNRDQKMIHYFSRLGLPPSLALWSLYGIAAFEVLLGALFAALLVWSLLPSKRRKLARGMFADRTLHRLAFKSSIIIFVMFSVGDILFGDRAELWEHGTFIVLCLISYDLWYRSDQFLIKLQQELDEASWDDDEERSTQALDYARPRGPAGTSRG